MNPFKKSQLAKCSRDNYYAIEFVTNGHHYLGFVDYCAGKPMALLFENEVNQSAYELQELLGNLMRCHAGKYLIYEFVKLSDMLLWLAYRQNEIETESELRELKKS